MLNKYFLLIIAVFCVLVTSSNAQYTRSKIPHYMTPGYEELYLNHPAKLNPLIKKVVGIPAPPEWAKYKPEVNRILNSDGFELINITQGNNSQSETWIAINPTNPNNLIATANDNLYISGYEGYKMNSWFTMDGGNTWKSSPTPTNMGVYINKPSTGNMTIFDPGVAYDTKGNAVYTYGFTQITGTTSKDENGVFAVSSTDGGASWYGWGKDFAISPIALSSNESSNPFHDRYTVACDNVASSPYKDRFYITWQRFIANPGISFAYSDDYGATWSKPMIIGTGGTQAPMPAVGPNGEVYVAWINNVGGDESQAVVLKSTNGGKNWSNTIIAQKVISIGTVNTVSKRYTLVDKQGMRVSSPPQIAVDCSDKAYKGNVYVVQAGRETNGGKYGIWVSKSTNGGTTWKKTRIDNSEVRNDMFFPSITVDPITGTVAVMYYSSQNDATNNQGVDAYLSYSLDGGDSWNVLRITPTTFYINSADDVLPQGEEGNDYWGDYTSITSYNGIIYPLFWMPASPTGNFYSLDLFTAPISSKPKPVENLKAISMMNGSKINVKLTWTNPTVDLLNKPLDNFDIQIYRADVPGNPIATINKSQTPEYVDQNVTDGDTYTYNLKVVTTDKRESIYSSASILAGGALKPTAPTNVQWISFVNGVKISWTNPSTSIDGSQVRELSGIKIYIDGKLFKTISQNQSQIGNWVSEMVDLPTGTFAKMKITATATRDSKTAESDASEELLIYAGILYNKFNENFDGANVIPHYSDNGWVINSSKAVSAPNAISTVASGKYETNKSYNLFLPPIVVTPENQSFVFQHICLVHTTDAAAVNISTDWGKTYKGSRWFTFESSPNFKKGDLSGSSYEEAAVDLRPYIGDTVMIRLSVYSGSALTDLGWFIDNITTDNRVGIEEPISISENNLIISPNPASGYVNIQFEMLRESAVQIELVDLLGNRVLLTDLGNVSNFSNNFQLDLNTIVPGTYYVRLISGSTQIVRPLSIVR